MANDRNKPWGGRFTEPTNEFVERFTASIDFDKRLYNYDILGSIAHANMLRETNILSQTECKAIIDGLENILEEINTGVFEWSVELEDVHMNIEARLIEKIGDTGKKLHTGRSRNDQIATDVRLWLRDELDNIDQLIVNVLTAILDVSEAHTETIMPGYTHLQPAQPITFAHHLMAWFEMLKRDRLRLHDCRKRMNQCPLGSAALAGTTFPINRELTAKALGFDDVCQNSIDAVSDRDFAMEFLSTASIMSVHMSRWCEELIFWSSQQFDFIEIPDEFCTGSSIMPQKKNPDVPELIRGKSARVIANLTQLLILMKGQPLSYNKDNQEDKEPLFDTVDTVKDCLKGLGEIIRAIKPKIEVLRQASIDGYTTATDLADYLVRKGVAFRDAHEIVGRTVAYAIKNHLSLHEIALEKLKYFSSTIESDVFRTLTLEGSINARAHTGGTAPVVVNRAIQLERKKLTSEQ